MVGASSNGADRALRPAHVATARCGLPDAFGIPESCGSTATTIVGSSSRAATRTLRLIDVRDRDTRSATRSRPVSEHRRSETAGNCCAATARRPRATIDGRHRDLGPRPAALATRSVRRSPAATSPAASGAGTSARSVRTTRPARSSRAPDRQSRPCASNTAVRWPPRSRSWCTGCRPGNGPGWSSTSVSTAGSRSRP